MANRVTQVAVETLEGPNANVHARVTQVAVETLATLVPVVPAQRGNIDYDQIRVKVRQGIGGKFQMFGGGTPTSGNLAVYDTGGNVIDGGPVPIPLALKTNGIANGSQSTLNLVAGTNVTLADSGTGSVTITAASGGGGGSVPLGISSGPDWPPASAGSRDDEFTGSSLSGSWTQVNATGSSAVLNQSWINLIPKIVGGAFNIYAITQPQPVAVPWTILAKVNALDPGFNYWSGLCVSDGTKFISFGPGISATLRYARWSNVTTNASDGSVNAYGINMSGPVYIKIVNDGSNLTFYVSANGAHWFQPYQESVTVFLSATTSVGLFALITGGTNDTGMHACDFFRSTP